jgi:hypothetical protein
MAIRRALGEVKTLCCFGQRQAGETTQLNQPSDDRFPASESGQRFIDGEHFGAGRIHGQLRFQQLLPLPAAAMLLGLFAASVVDEDAPHGLGSGREEMGTAVPALNPLRIDQAKIGFMD